MAGQEPYLTTFEILEREKWREKGRENNAWSRDLGNSFSTMIILLNIRSTIKNARTPKNEGITFFRVQNDSRDCSTKKRDSQKLRIVGKNDL